MKHRHKIEHKVIDSDGFAVKVGALGTVVIYIASIVGAIYLFTIDRTMEGIILGAAAAASRSLALFRSHSSDREKINNKTK